MLTRDGYNPSLQVNALAGQTPPGEVGDQWRRFNEGMWKKSGGFLAASPSQDMEICTARGGHSTGAVRLLTFGGQSNKKELTFIDDGNIGPIKTSRILEAQPSLKQVVADGMEYDRQINLVYIDGSLFMVCVIAYDVVITRPVTHTYPIMLLLYHSLC